LKLNYAVLSARFFKEIITSVITMLMPINHWCTVYIVTCTSWCLEATIIYNLIKSSWLNFPFRPCLLLEVLGVLVRIIPIGIGVKHYLHPIPLKTPYNLNPQSTRER
jgi:hypothetical protein